MFTLSERHIRRLFEVNAFPVSDTDMIFFGLRGCLPADMEEGLMAEKEHTLELWPVNHRNLRCTIGQWRPREETFHVFPASTVPHRNYIRASLRRNGRGANQLMTGFFRDFRKGRHRHGTPFGHDAFRQSNRLPIRRTSDDLDYDTDDRVEYMAPFDNIHAAWCMGINMDTFASAGCQVIMGYPQCERVDADYGPWRTFVKAAYALPQDRFDYALFEGTDAQRIAHYAPSKKHVPRLRYGSVGKLVEDTQRKLMKRYYYEGRLDGLFGPRTLRAVLEFQHNQFGPQADDGIVGAITFQGLAMNPKKV